MASVAFLSPENIDYPAGPIIADWLREALKRHKIQIFLHDQPALYEEIIARSDIVIVHDPIPDHAIEPPAPLLRPDQASLRIRHTRHVARVGRNALNPPPRTLPGTSYQMGTIWLPGWPTLPRPPEMAPLPPLIKHAAQWLLRHRQNRQSLELARIYAAAPLFATAF